MGDNEPTDAPARGIPRIVPVALTVIGAILMISSQHGLATCYDDPGWTGHESSATTLADVAIMVGVLVVLAGMLITLFSPRLRPRTGTGVTLFVTVYVGVFVFTLLVGAAVGLSCQGLLD